MTAALLLTFAAYVVGATPASYWVGRAAYGVDLRAHGSGNLGATNAFRVLGWKAGAPVVLADVLKGLAPALWFPRLDELPASDWGVLYGAAAIAGHAFSFWTGFRGGKGVATGAGVLAALSPPVLAVALVAWGMALLLTRYVSLASISAAGAAAMSAWLVAGAGTALRAFLLVTAGFVAWSHRGNLARLRSGEEPKVGEPAPASPRRDAEASGPLGRPAAEPAGEDAGAAGVARGRRASGSGEDDADRPVAVVGAGSWGTALAKLLAESGRVRLWAREPEVVDSIEASGENAVYLKGVPLDRGRLRATCSLERALGGARAVVWACPVQHSAAVLARAAPFIAADALVVSCSKGIEVETKRRMDEVFAEFLPTRQVRRFCALSGPSFAREVAAGRPTAVVVASRDEDACLAAQALLQTDRFRVYTSPDVVGVQLAGALKNVVALAAGVASGLGLGSNAVAALITRGLAETSRLGGALGAQAVTFAGLAGLGDLVLTCTGELSRNRAVGVQLGKGRPIGEILKRERTVAEGVATVRAVNQLADRLEVEMPLCAEAHRIVVEGADPTEALSRLMTRQPKPENPELAFERPPAAAGADHGRALP